MVDNLHFTSLWGVFMCKVKIKLCFGRFCEIFQIIKIKPFIHVSPHKIVAFKFYVLPILLVQKSYDFAFAQLNNAKYDDIENDVKEYSIK